MNISLTDSAATQLRRMTPSDGAVRLSLKQAGCAGVMYRLEAEASQPSDVALTFEGFTLFVAGPDIELLDGTVIDCVEDFAGRRITFSNARESARCGCGLSVSM